MNFPRKRLMLVSVSLTAFLLLSFWFLQRLLAPSVDPSTPVNQNGYSLLAYNPQEQTPLPPPRNIFERWLQGILERPTDWYNRSGLMLSVPASPVSGSMTAYTVTATASTGDTFPLGWYQTAAGNQHNPHVEVRVDLPKGYPDTYQWLDVTIKDKQGHTARWRLRKLPRLKQAILPGTATPSTTVAGISVEGRAWWDPQGQRYSDSSRAPQSESKALNVEVRAPWPAERPNASPTSYWKLTVDETEPEWQTARGKPFDNSYSASGTVGGCWSSVGSNLMLAGAELFPTPCAAAQSVVRVTGRIIAADHDSEVVSLEGLPLKRSGKGFVPASSVPTSYRTTSGTVVQVSPAKATFFPEHLSPNEVRFKLALPGRETKVVVPASKLYKRYRKPLDIYQNIYWSDKDQTSMTQRHGYQTVAFRKSLTSLKMPSLTLTVTQTVELDSKPFMLVLPVKKGHPARRWDAP